MRGWLIGILLISLVITGSAIGWISLYKSTREVKTIRVQRMWIKQYGKGSKYLFSDENGNVYSIEDSLELWIFDASDRWASMQEGKTYRVTLYGWRWHFFSWYKNAIEIEEIEG